MQCSRKIVHIRRVEITTSTEINNSIDTFHQSHNSQLVLHQWNLTMLNLLERKKQERKTNALTVVNLGIMQRIAEVRVKHLPSLHELKKSTKNYKKKNSSTFKTQQKNF